MINPAFINYMKGDYRRKVDYQSGYEADLEQWIFNQPDFSIDPLSLFSEVIGIQSWEYLGSASQQPSTPQEPCALVG